MLGFGFLSRGALLATDLKDRRAFVLHLLTNSINKARIAKVLDPLHYLGTEGRPRVVQKFDLANALIYFLCAHVGRRRGDCLDVAGTIVVYDQGTC